MVYQSLSEVIFMKNSKSPVHSCLQKTAIGVFSILLTYFALSLVATVILFYQKNPTEKIELVSFAIFLATALFSAIINRKICQTFFVSLIPSFIFILSFAVISTATHNKTIAEILINTLCFLSIYLLGSRIGWHKSKGKRHKRYK